MKIKTILIRLDECQSILPLCVFLIVFALFINQKKTRKSKKNSGRPTPLKYAKSAPTGVTPGGPGSGSSGDDEKSAVSVELVSKMFQSCLQSRQKDQKIMMEEFHRRIRTWNHSMLDTPAQTIVVNVCSVIVLFMVNFCWYSFGLHSLYVV